MSGLDWLQDSQPTLLIPPFDFYSRFWNFARVRSFLLFIWISRSARRKFLLSLLLEAAMIV
jgi:hypothetical protein